MAASKGWFRFTFRFTFVVLAHTIGTGSGSDVFASPGQTKGMTPVSVYNRAKSRVAPSSLNSTAASPVFFYQGAQTEHAA